MSFTTLSDREIWILRLLYAPVEGNKPVPIVGTTRLMKGLFLVQRKFEEEFEIDPGFEFQPDKYGPLDERVYEALDSLDEEGLLTREESTEYDGLEYELTFEGERVGRRQFQELAEDQQQMISWIKGRHVLRELSQLLSFVYNRYPNSASESVLKEG